MQVQDLTTGYWLNYLEGGVRAYLFPPLDHLLGCLPNYVLFLKFLIITWLLFGEHFCITLMLSQSLSEGMKEKNTSLNLYRYFLVKLALWQNGLFNGNQCEITENLQNEPQTQVKFTWTEGRSTSRFKVSTQTIFLVMNSLSSCPSIALTLIMVRLCSLRPFPGASSTGLCFPNRALVPSFYQIKILVVKVCMYT